MIIPTSLSTMTPEPSDVPLNLSRGRRKQRHPRLSRYVDQDGFNESEAKKNAFQHRTSVSNTLLSAHSQPSSPLTSCKIEQSDSLKGAFLTNTIIEDGESAGGVFCTPNHETAEAVSSITEPFEYRDRHTKLSVMTNDSPNEARRYGTPVFPPASENDRTSPVADTSSFGLCSTDSTMSKTLETGKIYPGSDYQPQSGVPQTENSPSYQQPNYAIAAAHLTQSQPGLKSLHAMTSGYWQQSAIITPPEQMILPGNYAPMFPTADSFSASMAYTSAATPLGASWPWMMSVGSNIYNQSTSFRDSVQPGSPNIAPALSVSIMRGAMDMASQYNSDSGIKSITASAQLNAIPEYSRPSAFHVVSRDHTDSQMSAHESSTDQILDEDSSNTMPDKSFRALKSKRTPYRRTRRRVKSRPGSLEEILNDSINSSTPDLSHGSWMKEGATAVYKSCPYGWSSNTDEAELNENSENEVKNQQPACSNSSRPSSTRSRPLNRNALKQMRQWYEAHIDRPYPTTAEKLQLARLGGIKLSQVNSWFANQRTRSCNTRPKKKLQRLHSRLKDVAVELEQMTQGIVSAADLELQLRSIVDSYLA